MTQDEINLNIMNSLGHITARLDSIDEKLTRELTHINDKIKETNQVLKDNDMKGEGLLEEGLEHLKRHEHTQKEEMDILYGKMRLMEERQDKIEIKQKELEEQIEKNKEDLETKLIEHSQEPEKKIIKNWLWIKNGFKEHTGKIFFIGGGAWFAFQIINIIIQALNSFPKIGG